MSRSAHTLLILSGLALAWLGLSAARHPGGPEAAPRSAPPSAAAPGVARHGSVQPGILLPAIAPSPAERPATEPLVGTRSEAARAQQAEPAADPGRRPHLQSRPEPAPVGSSSAAQPSATRLPIVEYHYSTFAFAGVEMRPEWFEAQLAWLAENEFHTLTIDELADFVEGKAQPPQRSVALTFDVGISHFDDYATVVIPALRRYGLHGIFFVQAHGVRETCDGQYTCWDALAAWLDGGLISIGSHTLYHQDFNTLDPAQIAFELRRSKEILHERLGVEAVGVCYPFDSVNSEAFAILQSLGYRFAVGGWTRTERSALFGDTQPFSLPRYYPYARPGAYPAIAGMGGQTFADVIAAAVAPVE